MPLPDMKSTLSWRQWGWGLLRTRLWGIASFYIFSKACYLHKDYFKLLAEIFPKPSAHSLAIIFLSISHKTNSSCDSEQMWECTEVYMKNITVSSVCTEILYSTLIMRQGLVALYIKLFSHTKTTKNQIHATSSRKRRRHSARCHNE